MRDRPAGLIRLNASTWGADRLLPIIAGFMADYPDVRIDLVTNGRLVDIIAEGFDAGLRLSSVVPQDMVALPLGIEEALVIVGAPAYLDFAGVPQTPGDLLAHQCLRARLPSGAVMAWHLGKDGEGPEVDVTGRLILGTTVLAAKAAAAGLGLAYVERREAEAFLADGRLVQVLADWTPPFDGEALYYPRQRHPSAAFRAFVDYVKAWKAARHAAATAPA
nr:LysR substrate-binding domain-containing protein [Ancylobacter koreensis]